MESRTDDSMVLVSQEGVVNPIDRLLSAASRPAKESVGFLLGAVPTDGDAPCSLVCSCSVGDQSESTSSSELNAEWEKLKHHLPIGVDICGLYFVSESASNPKSVSKSCNAVIDDTFKTNLSADALIVAHIQMDDPAVVPGHFYRYDVATGQAAPCQVRIGNDIGTEGAEFVTFRVQGNLRLNTVYHGDNDILEALTQKFNSLCSRVQSFTALYHVQKTRILIGGGGGDITAGPLSRDSHAGDISRHILAEDTGFLAATQQAGKRAKKEDKSTHQVLDVQLLFRLSLDEEQEGSSGLVPYVHYQIYDQECRRSSMVLPVDVPVTVRRTASVATLGRLFADGVCRQLRAMEECLKHHLEECGLSVPQPYHFKLPHLPSLVTVVYPTDLSEDQLEATRRQLHNRFLLPLERPLFRRANAYSYPTSAKTGGYLLNTHVGLPPSGVAAGQLSLVYGTYTYHHYMQDRFDDDKWGCAYRSLQTLASWFHHQGYTGQPVPSHRAIQQALVEVGDKPAKFVGSRQWIGSFEVSTVLNQLLGVTCKLLYVNTGAEMANKGRELAAHFRTQGTPVMIGGGVLAHTILGVDFSESSGDIKFLILDPHYTGSEDLKVIQDKGWCGWKGIDFWDQTAYYNMCMPQRPIEI